MQHEAPVLLAGNRSDIDLMAELIRQLPPWVHGQVLVEVREPAHIEELEVPAEGSDDPGPELIWVGGSDWPEVTGLCQDLIHRHTRLHLHHADVF